MLFIQSTPAETDKKEEKKIFRIMGHNDLMNVSLRLAHSINKNHTALTLSAGCALATALVLVELNQAGDGSDNVSL